jgi:membrane protein
LTLRTRALPFALVLTSRCCCSRSANAVVRAGGDFVAAQFGWTNASLLAIGAEAVSCAGTLVLFFTIYRILPTRPFGTRSALLAAAATTVLFTVGRLAIGYYLGHSTASLVSGWAPPSRS